MIETAPAYHHIMHPTDFSPKAARGRAHALALAKLCGLRLSLQHAIHSAVEEKYYPEVQQRIASEELNRLASEIRAQGVEVEGFVAAGPHDRRIVEFAGREDVDVIVMGTHGRNPLGRVVLGSVADKVVRNAPCPVMTVCPEAGDVVSS